VAWARPTPPASLFGQTRLDAVVVAEAPATEAELRPGLLSDRSRTTVILPTP
jgi:hypothetical protein